MMRKLFLVAFWFPSTLILLLIELHMLAAISPSGSLAAPLSATPYNENSVTANSGSPQVLSAQVIAGDARTLLLENFFKQYKSPMTPYANYIVEQADQYQLPFQLLPAIAMCESNLGKHVPLKSGFNPFGIAVYTGTQQGKEFESWEHAISWASKYVHDKYYAKGVTDLIGIQQHWAPPAAETGNSWANCVQYFEDSII